MRKKFRATIKLNNKVPTKVSEKLTDIGVLKLEHDKYTMSNELISALVRMGVIDSKDNLVTIKLTVQS